MSAVASVKELRATAVDPATPLYLQGYYVPGDGGEGVFLHQAGDTTSLDNNGTVLVDSANQRWFRQTGGQPINVLWFGAHPDNSHASETTAAIQHAIQAAQAIAGGGTVWFPAGAYSTDGPMQIVSAVTLIGSGNFTIGGATRIVPTSRSWNWINISAVNFGVKISGIALGKPGSATGSGGVAIHIHVSQKVTIEDVYIVDCWSGILNDSSGAVELRRIDVGLADMPPSGSYRFGVKCTGYTWASGIPHVGNPNSTFCDSVWVTQGGTHIRSAHGFVLTDKYQSLTLSYCSASTCQYGRWVTAGSFGAPDFLVDFNGTAEGCDTGWAIDAGDAGSTAQISNTLCLSSSRMNYYVNTSHNGDVQFNGCRVSASGGITSGNGAGFALFGNGNYVLSGCIANHTGGHNVAVAGSGSISVSGGSFSWPVGADRDSFHIYSNATGTLCLGGVNQHNATRGIRDDGSTCMIYGNALFRVNSSTNYDLALNHSTPASFVYHP